MPQTEPTMKEFWTLDIGIDDRHDCEGMAGEIRYKPWLKRWCLDTFNKENLPVTYCPWCGEKLPEIVITPPEPTEEQVRKWRKPRKNMARKFERWLDQSEAPL